MAPQWDGAAGCAWLQGAEDIDAPPALHPVLGGERTGAVGARRGHPCISRLLSLCSDSARSERPALVSLCA